MYIYVIKLKNMKQEILNLADDLELELDKRKEFIAEMELAVKLMRKNDFDQFYAVADVVMQRYS